MFSNSKRRFQACLSAVLIVLAASCGGGGGGGGAAAVSSKVSASPALGCFDDGATVKAYAMAGTEIGSGTVQSCRVSLDLGSHTGPFILKTLPGSHYFDESTGAKSATPYSGNGILSVVPSVTVDKNYALNLITNLIAAQAGINPASPSMADADPIAAITAAKNKVLSYFGVDEATLGGDIFASPIVLSGSNALTGALTGANLYAGLLADLAASSTNPGQQADELFLLVQNARTSTGTAKSNSLSALSTKMVASLTRLSDGSSALFTNPALGGAGLTKATGIDVAAIQAKAQENIAAEVKAAGIATRTVTTAGIVVVPDLGRVSGKVTVEAYNPQTGALISGGTALVDANTGAAALELGGYSGSVVLKVTLDATAKYYDEGKAADATVGNEFVLLGMVPASSIKNNTEFSVSILTHTAAAFAGLRSDNLKITAADADAVQTAMLEALARTRLMLGLRYIPSSETEARFALNPLTATDPLSTSTAAAGVDTSKAGGYLSLLLAELAKEAGAETQLANPSALGLAQVMHASVANLVAAQYSAAAAKTFQDSVGNLVLSRALDNVGGGKSTFLSKCKLISSALTKSINARFKSPTDRMTAAPSAGDLAGMVEELQFSIGLQNKGFTPSAFDAQQLSTCTQ